MSVETGNAPWRRELAEAVRRIACVLEGSIALPHQEGTTRDPSDAELVSAARRMLVERRRLEQAFGADLFADPVRDMLLDLFIAAISGRRVQTSSLCIAAAVPATTALRHIRVMKERGICLVSPDQTDGRRTMLHLSDNALATMRRYVGWAARQ